jgi:hypothetical protein
LTSTQNEKDEKNFRIRRIKTRIRIRRVHLIRTKTGNDEDDVEPQLTSNKERTKSSKEIKVGGSRGNLKKTI